MSEYSGKCDVFDWFGSIAKEENETPYECYLRRGSKLYVNDAILDKNAEPIKIEKPSDLVMYYPFIVATASFNPDNIFLSSRPYPCCFLDMGRPRSYYFYTNRLMEEYERVVAEEDPKYVS